GSRTDGPRARVKESGSQTARETLAHRRHSEARARGAPATESREGDVRRQHDGASGPEERSRRRSGSRDPGGSRETSGGAFKNRAAARERGPRGSRTRRVERHPRTSEL